MSDLWLPPSARRRQKADRPDSTDYRQIVSMAIDPDGALSYDAFVSAMREDWEDQFTAAEKHGPITFEHYMGLSYETIGWRMTDDIPKRLQQGVLDQNEAKVCTDFFRRLKDYAESYLRSKGAL